PAVAHPGVFLPKGSAGGAPNVPDGGGVLEEGACPLLHLAHPISTVCTVGTSVPGTAQQVHWDWAVAAGWPPMSTVALPWTTRPPCWGGARNGSLGWRPTWGGVHMPLDPMTAAALPPISTVETRPWSSGAEKGRGGDG